MEQACMDSPMGKLWITADGKEVVRVSFDRVSLPEGTLVGRNMLLDRAIAQLEEYFRGERRKFDLPLAQNGTPFQRRVYSKLLEIPYGQTRSYKEIAQALGNPGAVRAVGGANNKNPIPILVPCHRVVGADGSLTGYAGGVERKAWLLEFERRHRL